MQTITYTDKVALNVNSNVDDINKCNASDMNEIKTVVNNNASETSTGLTNLQNSLDDLCTFSTSGIFTGQKWINNENIFRRVFTGTSATENGVSIDLSALDADIIVNIYGWVKSTYGQWWPINNHYPQDDHYDTSVNYVYNSSVTVHCESYFSYPEYRIVIEYTKTN